LPLWFLVRTFMFRSCTSGGTPRESEANLSFCSVAISRSGLPRQVTLRKNPRPAVTRATAAIRPPGPLSLDRVPTAILQPVLSGPSMRNSANAGS
jgi:hypothetical protein